MIRSGRERQPTVHRINPRNPRQILLPRTLRTIPRNSQMRTLGIKLRLIRNMQRNNLMSYQIIPRFQTCRYRLSPEIRSSVPVLEYSLTPHSFLDRAADETALGDLEPLAFGGVEGSTVGAAVCHPEDHGPDCVQPVVVNCCYVIAGANGY